MGNDDNNIRTIAKMRAVHELHIKPNNADCLYNKAFYSNDVLCSEYSMNTTTWD